MIAADVARVAAEAREAARPKPRGGGGSRSVVGASGADGDADVAPVEAHLDHAVAERCGDLRGEVGERVHQGQPGGGLDRRAEQRGGALGLLVTRCGGGREVLPQLGDVRLRSMTPLWRH